MSRPLKTFLRPSLSPDAGLRLSAPLNMARADGHTHPDPHTHCDRHSDTHTDGDANAAADPVTPSGRPPTRWHTLATAGARGHRQTSAIAPSQLVKPRSEHARARCASSVWSAEVDVLPQEGAALSVWMPVPRLSAMQAPILVPSLTRGSAPLRPAPGQCCAGPPVVIKVRWRCCAGAASMSGNAAAPCGAARCRRHCCPILTAASSGVA